MRGRAFPRSGDGGCRILFRRDRQTRSGCRLLNPLIAPAPLDRGYHQWRFLPSKRMFHPQVWNWLNGDPVVIKTTDPGIRSATDKIARIAGRFRSGRPISTRGQEPVIPPDLRKGGAPLVPVQSRFIPHAPALFIADCHATCRIRQFRFSFDQSRGAARRSTPCGSNSSSSPVRIRTARTGSQVRPSHNRERMG